MRFRSAKEDLEGTTLAAVPGVLARLDYLSGLRQADGGYAHWGLTKTHGKEAAEKALAQAHREAIAQMLRQPLAQLYGEIDVLGKMLERTAEQLLPPGADALARAHFNLVWGAMANVARRRKPRLPAA